LYFGFLTRDIKISSKKFIAIVLLYSSTFSWFFFFYAHDLDVFSSLGLGNAGSLTFFFEQTLFLSSVAIFAVIGSLISEKYSRRKLLMYWITLGVLATASLWAVQGILLFLLSTALIGISFGLGFPVVQAFLSESTAIEERARVSGIVILAFFIIVIIAEAFASLIGVILLSVILRSIGFFALALDPFDREKGKEVSWGKIFSNKDFVFYLFPWVMFNVANGLVYFVWFRIPPDFEWASALGNILHLLGTGLCALISGVMADRLGRKQPIIIGLVMLGVSYGILGLALSPESWLFYLTFSGFAWGFIMVVYFAVPGDLAFPGSQERFYALMGVLPFILFMSFSGIVDLIRTGPPVSVLSPILSIILFLSVVPVLRARETLSEKEMREREVREYLEDKARKFGKNSKRT
jgi:MFS family permease